MVEEAAGRSCARGGVLIFFTALILRTVVDSNAQKLISEEVHALQRIAVELNNTKWNFSGDPCSGTAGWMDPPTSNPYVVNNLTCTCNATSRICHVVAIQLKGQNLTGVLPDEFSNLTLLSVLDLTRNKLKGSIPSSWVSLPLTQLFLHGNRISGNIPEELGSITTLQTLTLEDNQLQGPIPSALGNLINLKRLLLSANNFTGVLPDSLGKLKQLTDFRIDGNPVIGKIPEFIGNWTALQRLDIQGTSMEGPFPAMFLTLSNITVLRVSDLKIGDGKFPPLQSMRNIRELVLRNLSISGQLPNFIGEMADLQVLDLSFNNLSGPIPDSFDGLQDSVDFLYFTNNKLSGTIPNWILSSKKNIDMSFNSFTGPSEPLNCQQGNVNLVSSYSTTDSNLIPACLKRNYPCSGEAKNYNLFINCGGSKVTIGDNEYEEDTLPQGASTFRISESTKWAFSSTGYFVGDDKAPYIAQNTSLLHMNDSQLYMTARLSPLSLRYFGLCLQRGTYTVKLYFAEIVFTDGDTYSSIGQRRFDVSIQGKKVLRDFDVAKEAKGTNKEIIKSFTTVVNGTLDIHFQWGGKGTNLIPRRGVYGPIVSAITVTPNFKPRIYHDKLSLWAILGIVTAIVVIIFVGLALLWFCLRRKGPMNRELRGLELQTGYFSLRQIKAATNNFDPANKIGEGGFGPVYKGILPDGSEVAVKQLSSKSKQGSREFINEVGIISALQHPNLVKLFGCSIDGDQLLLVYEFMQNNSLARALFGVERDKLHLDWQTRSKICLGVARGLAYLHEESRLKIVHRDIKATNILLDKDLTPKIADFGLAKLDEEEHSHISTRIAGTIGYMAPEYAMRGYLTDKADVYSFGVVVLELVSGKSNTSYRHKEFVTLLDWAHVLQQQENMLELVDTTLGSYYSREEALNMLRLSLICTNSSPSLRPKMSDVVKMLEGKMIIQVPSFKGAKTNDEDSSKGKRILSDDDSWTHSSVPRCSLDIKSCLNFQTKAQADGSAEIEEYPLIDRETKTI